MAMFLTEEDRFRIDNYDSVAAERDRFFSYDDNTDDENFVDGLLPVTNIAVDGVWARDMPNFQLGSNEYSK